MGRVPLETLRTESLVHRAVDGIRSMVDSGEWTVGTRIPPEPVLAESLGVGRNTVREAVRALAHVGVLEVRRGSGTYVVATTEIEALMGRQAERHELQHLLEVRHALEVSAVQSAARRRTADDLAEIDEIAARRGATTDRAAFVEADVALHVAVVRASHNPILTGLYLGLVDTLRTSIDAQDGRDGTGGLPPRHDPEHEAMIEAVRAGDPDAAAAATSALLRHLGLRTDATSAPSELKEDR